MSQRMAYVNGRILPDDEASVSIYDLGFQYGIGVFERTRTFHGVPFRLDEHLDRLFMSLKMTRLSAAMSKEHLTQVTLDVLGMNRDLLGPDDDYSIGHFVSAGPLGDPTVVVFCQPLPFKKYAHQYHTGAHVVTPSTRQMPIDVVDPKLKTTSRINFHLAEGEAKLVDPDAYALLLDAQANVCEVSPGANFWIVRDGTAISPPGRSILRGISRDTLFDVAQRVGIPAKEAEFQLYDVTTAEEAFLTVTSRCVMPVTKVNGAPIGTGKPGPVVGRLQAGWSELVGMDFVAQAMTHVAPQPSEKASPERVLA